MTAVAPKLQVKTSRGPSPAHIAYWRLRGAVPRRNTYTVTKGVGVGMPDGAVFRADLYRPADATSHPTVLVRTPYGRAQSALEAAFFAARGYTVLVVAARGTDGSDGEFVPMTGEAADGPGVVEWMRQQEWFDGSFATYGARYMTFTQFALATNDFPEWRGMALQAGPHDFADIAYRRGAFDLDNYYGWSAMMANRDELNSMFGAMRQMSKDAKQAVVRLAGTSLLESPTSQMKAKASWFTDWALHPDPTSEFWRDYSYTEVLEKITMPVLIIGGYQDLFFPHTVQQWQTLQRNGVDVEVHLQEIGLHAAGAKGLLDLRTANATVRWFDRLFSGAHPVAASPRFDVAVAGAKHEEHIAVDSWPPASTAKVLHALANGELVDAAPPTSGGVSSFTYDAADPTPSIGGPLMTPNAGYHDNAPLEKRDDVLVFTSAPLQDDLLIVGTPSVSVDVDSTTGDYDLFARLCDVDARGVSTNVCDDLTRFSGDASRRAELELRGVAHRFQKGHRVRLQISGGAFPRFSINPALRDVGVAPADSKSVTHTLSHLGFTLSLPTLPS